jgi:hypothetical protein
MKHKTQKRKHLQNTPHTYSVDFATGDKLGTDNIRASVCRDYAEYCPLKSDAVKSGINNDILKEPTAFILGVHPEDSKFLRNVDKVLPD